MERYANSARKLLVRFRPDLPTSLPSNRRGLVTSVEQALARRARGQVFRQRFARGGAIAAAAVVLLAGGLALSRFAPALGGATGGISALARARGDRSLVVLGAGQDSKASSGAVIVGPGASPQPLTHGMTLEPGIRLVAPPSSEVRIGTAEGTQLILEPGGELTIVEQSAVQRYSLQHGAIRARVAKLLQPGERFIIATEDSQIEVHGTAFRVAMVAGNPNCMGGVKTRVTVSEGVVSVRSAGGSETFVPAGGEWPEACAAVAEVKPELKNEQKTGQLTEQSTEQSDELAAAAGENASGALASKYRRSRHAKHAANHAARMARLQAMVTAAPSGAVSGPKTIADDAGAPAPVASPSTLSAQNDLFAAAVRAKRQRQAWESVELFSRLVDTYPHGPLTEGAMVQRMKILSSVDETAAARAASEYLTRFPGGFARAAAHRIAGASP